MAIIKLDANIDTDAENFDFLKSQPKGKDKPITATAQPIEKPKAESV